MSGGLRSVTMSEFFGVDISLSFAFSIFSVLHSRFAWVVTEEFG